MFQKSLIFQNPMKALLKLLVFASLFFYLFFFMNFTISSLLSFVRDYFFLASLNSKPRHCKKTLNNQPSMFLISRRERWNLINFCDDTKNILKHFLVFPTRTEARRENQLARMKILNE